MSGQAEPLNLKQFIYELDVPVIVGGCATYQAALHLMRTGAAGVLVGFGGGASHTTRTVLGVAVPMASAVADVAAARRDYLDESGGRYVHVIADGGVGRCGDLAKAIACGADAVMMGSPLARAAEAPGRGLPLGIGGAPPGVLPRGEPACGVGTIGAARGDPAPGHGDHRVLRRSPAVNFVACPAARAMATHRLLRRSRSSSASSPICLDGEPLLASEAGAWLAGGSGWPAAPTDR